MSRRIAARSTRTATIAVVSAGALALTLSGCAYFGPPHVVTDAASGAAAGLTRVTIDSPDGAVEVRGVAGLDEVSIERTVHYRGPEREISETHRFDDDQLVLGGCGRNCSVDYTVEVPAGVDVSGETSNGAITLSDVGEVDVQTSNGRVDLADVAGTVSASSSNGRIVGRGLTGTGIDVDTSNGEIDLKVATPQDVSADTSNGSIRIAVPDASYRIDAHTSNGGTEIGVADDPAGEFELALGSSNGSVTVEAAG